jgi:hypothetical protein
MALHLGPQVFRGEVDLAQISPLGQTIQVRSVEYVLLGLSGASATWSSAIPIASIPIGLTCKVEEAVTGDGAFTGFDIGDGVDQDRFGANLNPGLGQIHDGRDWTDVAIKMETTAKSIRLTAIGGSFTGGIVRLTLHYIKPKTPT